jgi:hypothetical protein
MENAMPNRTLLILSTLLGGLFLMVMPVHAEQEKGSILATDSPLENNRHNDRDKEEATSTKAEKWRSEPGHEQKNWFDAEPEVFT